MLQIYSIFIFNHIFSQALPIMLALRLMLLATYYSQNYAGIIGWSLATRNSYVLYLKIAQCNLITQK